MTMTKQATQHVDDLLDLLDLLEFHRRQAEAWADSHTTRESGTYYRGKTEGFKAAIDLVKQLKETV